MTSAHITSAYDRELEEIQNRIMKMTGMVEQAIHDAARALETRDVERAAEIRGRDKAIDALEVEVDEAVALLIARRAPTAGDLRMVLALLKIAGNLERIGDYAKNMAKRTSVLVDMPVINGSASALRRMADEVEKMLRDATDAYLRQDSDLALSVIDRDVNIDQMYNALFREFLTFMMEDPRNISPCMHLHFMAKNVERMGDHVTAIAEQVVFFLNGAVPDEGREKDDRTSHDAALSSFPGQGG